MPIFIYSLKRSMRNKAAIVTQFVLPLVLIFFRPLWQNEQANGLGLLALIMMSSSVFMTQSILNDREDGVIVRILTSPITMLHYLSQNLLSAVLPLIVQTTIILAIGKGLYSWSWELTAGLLIIYTIFWFCFGCFCLCLVYRFQIEGIDELDFHDFLFDYCHYRRSRLSVRVAS